MRQLIVIALILLCLGQGCGSEQNAVPETAEPPLLRAAASGDLPALSSLLRQTSSVDVRDQCQWTPLMKAALNGHAEALNQLLLAGADVNASDKGGYTPLMLAASNNQAACVALLAAHGAALDHAEPSLGWTALIWAAKQGHRDAVQVLLTQGANPALIDKSGKTAADWARENRHARTLALLHH